MLACHTPPRKAPDRIHRSLTDASLQAASTGVSQRYRPPAAFVFMGREGDSVSISSDGFVRRVRVYDRPSTQWVWLHCAAFPASAVAKLPLPAAASLPIF
jgi:hypothetical protein